LAGLPLQLQEEIAGAYGTLSADPRYGHFVRIPQRICRCLDYFEVRADRAAVIERLHAYYLFIGVVDDHIDSTNIEAGKDVLRELIQLSPGASANTSPSALVTRVLRSHIDARFLAEVVARFEQLYAAVIGERQAKELAAFVQARRNVGRLTAEISYLLVSSLLEQPREDVRLFLEDVGEVGCLVDSVIDLRPDRRNRLLGFIPTLKDQLLILSYSLRGGVKISLRHPRLVFLFLEAIGDNLLDRLRSLDNPDKRRRKFAGLLEHKNIEIPSERLAGASWTKP